MKLYNFLITFVSLISLVAGLANQGDDDKKTKTTSKTTVWVTITSKGKLATVSSIYSQTFAKAYSSATADAKSGGIGLGSISGEVGKVRSYTETTIKQSNAGHGLYKKENVYGGIFGGLVLLGGALL